MAKSLPMTLEQFEWWCLFNEQWYSLDQFPKLISAFWQTFHELTM